MTATATAAFVDEGPKHWRLIPFALYIVYSAARHDLRPEHFIFLGMVAALTYIGPRARQLCAGLYPLALVGLLYDAMRPIQNLGLTAERVHLCGLRAVESKLFGFGIKTDDGAPGTLHDYFRIHHWTPVDLFCAIPYATFIFVCIATAIWLYRVDRPGMHRFTWSFFALNAAGFLTYHLFPAAPPWYFHEHGCVVDLAAHASEGPVLMRVDHTLGIAYFHGMYAKASSVFGAVPSLHCAYPLLVVVEGWRTFSKPFRVLALGYWFAMIFSAIYLDHHWMIDALVGSSYAVLAALTMRALQRRGLAGATAGRLASVPA